MRSAIEKFVADRGGFEPLTQARLKYLWRRGRDDVPDTSKTRVNIEDYHCWREP